MDAKSVLNELRGLANPSIKKVLLNHGAAEPLFGVKVEDLKKLQKKIKKDHQLALDLYATGISDAMYLAGLIADDAKMTRADLQRWAEQASWNMISEYTVAWVAAGSTHGLELALQWIDSKQESVASSGWSTLGSIVAVTPDDRLDFGLLKKLLRRVASSIHEQPNRVKYTMNGFVIGVGAYIHDLTQLALETAEKYGEVSVDMGATACKVPSVADYIRKIEKRGSIGKKRKMAMC
jgi:hypothetical protein